MFLVDAGLGLVRTGDAIATTSTGAIPRAVFGLFSLLRRDMTEARGARYAARTAFGIAGSGGDGRSRRYGAFMESCGDMATVCMFGFDLSVYEGVEIGDGPCCTT